MSHMDSSDDEYEMLHATPAETAQWKKLEEHKKLWKIQTNQLEVLKVREKVISEMQENDCYQRELLKKKDEEIIQRDNKIKKLERLIVEEKRRKEAQAEEKEEERVLIDSMTEMLEIELNWMDRTKDVVVRVVEDKESVTETVPDADAIDEGNQKHQLAPNEDNAALDENEDIRSIADAQCNSIGCANGITILNSAFICVTCSLLGNLISIVTSIATSTMQHPMDPSVDGNQGEEVAEKQEEAMIACAFLLADIISLLSFITHCPLFMVGKVVVEVLRLLLALIDDDSLAIDFHVVCLAVAVLWWRRLVEINAQLKAAREIEILAPGAAAELVAETAITA